MIGEPIAFRRSVDIRTEILDHAVIIGIRSIDVPAFAQDLWSFPRFSFQRSLQKSHRWRVTEADGIGRRCGPVDHSRLEGGPILFMEARTKSKVSLRVPP